MRPYRSLCVHIDFMRIHSLLYGTAIIAKGTLINYILLHRFMSSIADMLTLQICVHAVDFKMDINIQVLF